MGLSTLLACADTATSPPRTAAPPPSAAALAVPTATFAAIEDALDRAIPALGDEAAARGLRTAVEGVLDALSRKDNAGAVYAIERAEQLLDLYDRSAGDGDAADLDAIALALASVRP